MAWVGIGAGIGYLACTLIELDRRRAYEEGYYEVHYYDREPDYPVARRVGRDLVRSPYRPYSIIDVAGIPPGAVVEDPSTGGRFINPQTECRITRGALRQKSRLQVCGL